ncbi:hypothetical protein HDE_02123 [Halotydeus destructor]|nr:hypothetical protein HDE_02123 [Halotydeus destructor]
MNMITVYILCFTLLAGRLVNCDLASHYLDHYPPYNASLPPGLNESDFQEHFLAPKLYQFMIGGLSKVIWESMPGMVNDSQLAISDTCRSSLVETLDALTTGRKWAFEILDSSSKKPYGIMDGTLAYFGDYDQCLDIVVKGQAGESTGQYCAVNLMPLDTSPVPYLDEHYLHLTSLPVQGVGFYFGQCFPSNCSQSDVETIISTSLSHGYPLTLESLSCDTHEVNSYSYRFSHISESQKTSTYVSDNIIAKTFSIKQNLVKTFYISSSSKRSRALDGAKLALLMAAIVGHASFCLDVPQGLYLVGHHQSMLESTQSLITQPFINEARTGLIYLASGLTSFYVIDKALDNGFGSVSSIIASKYVKHVTALVAVIAHDLVWPLLFSGPLYNQAGQYVRDKCSRNFYDYLTLTHNRNGLDTCAAHTYVSAVDFQLFLVAIFVVYYLKVKVWV